MVGTVATPSSSSSAFLTSGKGRNRALKMAQLRIMAAVISKAPLQP